MLDSPTKKRIDDCRDILVGKLPDPKAQIEQITIALIYKFMADMDKEAVELGGKPKFFADYTIPDPENPKKKKKIEFEKFAWDNLFDTKVSAAQMLALYAEAITLMDKNPNIPQLFRDIFKNAFLPYRDPETLKLFLKTIGEFEYTHSEKLGDAFEYLLAVMGSQGDAGQFRTPRHIIDFLVSVVDPDITDRILDPACGTAGFLISAYKHIRLKHSRANKDKLNIFQYNNNYADTEKPFNDLGDKLNPDNRKRLIKNISGYDISPDMVRLSLVNLYLHGFSDPHIHEYDTLSSVERWDEYYDVILANPPFMSPKGGIRPHKKFSIPSNRSEVLFVDYIAEHLNPKGRAGIIVPEGIIFQSGTAYKALRKMLVENHLYAVVSLPAGVFNPYSGVKTSILLMNKEFAKTSEEILFVKIDNDGYNLGAQRTAVKGGQLEDAINAIASFVETHAVAPRYEGIAHAVPKAEIAKNGDYNLSGERYKATSSVHIASYPVYSLGDLISLEYGKSLPARDRKIGEFPVMGSNGISGFHREFLIEGPTIIVGRKGSAGEIVWEDRNCYPIDTTYYVKIKSIELLNLRYCYYVLKKLQLQNLRGGAGIPGLNRDDVYVIKIPLPPLSVQQEIVSEIDGYQKIIDGAKMIVDNYKPRIDIDPEWEMVELGEVAEVISGYSFDSTDFKKDNPIKCIKITNVGVREFVNDDTSRLPANFIKEYERFKVHENDLVISLTRSIISSGLKVTIVPKSWNNSLVNQRVAAIKSNGKSDINYIYHYLCSSDVYKYVEDKSRSLMQPNLSVIDLKEMEIPYPSLEIQRQIVAQIEQEQQLVNANKQLIDLFEKKIKDRIAKVWGE